MHHVTEADMHRTQERITDRVAVIDCGYRTPCWISNRAASARGYTYMSYAGRQWLTHRLSYEAFRGPIPNGLVIDHLCRQTACANPEHLDAVPQRINLIRGEGFVGQQSRRTRCINGHDLAGGNLFVSRRNTRHCRICRLASQRRSYARQRAARVALKATG